MSLRLLHLIFRQVLGLVLLLGRPSAGKDIELLVLRHEVAERAERRREEQWHTTAAERSAEAADSEVSHTIRDGSRYHLMIRTSRLLLPGSWFALVGFAAMLFGTDNLFVTVGGAIGLAAAGAYALTRRPDLGAD